MQYVYNITTDQETHEIQVKYISKEHHCGYDVDSKYMIFCTNESKSHLGSNRGLYSLEQTHVLSSNLHMFWVLHMVFIPCSAPWMHRWSWYINFIV